VTAYWNRLGTGSKAALIGLPVLVLVGGGLTLLVALGLGPLLNFLGANMWLVRFIVAATLVIVATIPTAFVIIYLELKVIARMNLRVGPDRVGPFGTAQSVIHGLKVLSKEDFAPTGVDVPIFTLAPVVVFLATIMTLMVVPFAPGVVGQDGTISLLYFFAIGGMAVVGLMMAGWASFNKYSLLGAIRAAAQAISYELPLTLSVVGVLILAGTMSMSSIVIQQGGPWSDANLVRHAGGSFLDWNIFKQPLGFIIFFIAGTAEANRTPLDMTEADQELVGGFRDRVLGDAVRLLLLRRIRERLRDLGGDDRPLFGGWNAPITLPFTLSIPLDPASVGFPLVILLTLGRSSGRSSAPCRSGCCTAGRRRSGHWSTASSCST